MRETLLPILVDPVARTPLRLCGEVQYANGCITEGALAGEQGRIFPIRNGIPRFVATEDPGQRQTAASFGYKWGYRSGYESDRVHSHNEQCEIERHRVKTIGEFRRIFECHERVLEAGCASGHHTSTYLTPSWAGGVWVGTDISSAIDIAQERLGGIANTHFVQADILQLPYRENSFDMIVSRGVLHHTPSTERAFKSLTFLLQEGGEFLFFIYRKNGPVREFTDDHVRAYISSLSAEEAWEALRPLNLFGRALSEAKGEVEVPMDVPYLGLKAGKYTVHRLIYDFFLKAFWKPDWQYDESALISFDWFHPHYAYRHTEDEIERWCADTGLRIFHLESSWTGFTVRAQKCSQGATLSVGR